MLRLYSYFRSSASYRVRIALNLKGLEYETVPVHLVRDGGRQNAPEFRALNPAGQVPVLDDHGQVFSQSLAIVEYLEETHPEPPLLPKDAAGRARVRALAQMVACDIHPINNLRVLKYLTQMLHIDEAAKTAWYRHWVEEGLAAFEAILTSDLRTGTFCHGDTPTLADLCLVPQVFNARRFDCHLDHVPTVMRINEACLNLPAFAAAAPSRQPDAE